jgi:uncharacterized protein
MPVRRVALLLCLSTSALPAQSAFVHLLKGDTIQIEKFTRTATRIDGEVTPKGGGRQTYSNVILPSGLLGTLTAFHSPGARADAAPMMRGELKMVGDSAIAVLTNGSQAPQTQRLASKVNANPILNTSIAIFEVLIGAARKSGSDSATVELLLASGGRTVPAALLGLTGDSVRTTIAGTAFYFITDKAGRVIRAGLPTQQLTVVRVDGIAVSKIGFAKPDYSAPVDAPYTAESVTIPTTAGHTLGGTFTKPVTTAGRTAVVISITGSGAQDRDEYISLVPGGYRLFRQVADTLGRRGVAMLRMDDRGYGESGGSFASATSRDFANDILAAITWLRARPDVDPRKIFLIGHSEGGMVAPMVAVDDPSLAGIVLLAGPGRSGREILNFQVRYGIEHDTTLTPAARDSQLARVPAGVDSVLKSTPWLTFFGAHDPIATARKVKKVPVLILQGGDDQQVIAAEAPLLEAAFRAGGNRDVTMRVFPSLNHFFIRQPGGSPAGYSTLPSNLAIPDVIGMAADWIAARASRGARP